MALAATASFACVPAPPPPPAPLRTVVEGLDYSEFVGTTVARRIRAEQVVVVPKRFGAFQVSALSELVLSRARIEVFEPAEAGAAPVVRGGIDALVPAEGFAVPGLAEVRHLAGATLYFLEVSVSRGGAAVARFGAVHARADPRTGNLVLEDFRLEHLPSGRVVLAPRATWRRSTGEFVIGGDYTLSEHDATRAGRGLLVGPDFAVRAP